MKIKTVLGLLAALILIAGFVIIFEFGPEITTASIADNTQFSGIEPSPEPDSIDNQTYAEESKGCSGCSGQAPS